MRWFRLACCGLILAACGQTNRGGQTFVNNRNDQRGAAGLDNNSQASNEAHSYLASIQNSSSVPDAFYSALLKYEGTQEAREATLVLVFHRDFLNGGMAQAVMNMHGHASLVLTYMQHIGPRLASARAAVAEADALYRSLPEAHLSGTLIDRYLSVLHAAEPRWDKLDEMYLAATNQTNPSYDQVERAILAYALDHADAFVVPAIAASEASPRRR